MADQSVNQNIDPKSQYSVGAIPYHVHNGTDSPLISPANVSAGTAIRLSGFSPVIINNVGVTALTAGTNIVLTPSTGTGVVTISSSGGKFGGTGAQGVLSVSSGNTNIDLGAQPFTVLNYTSISITGTGSVTFINPAGNGSVVVIKSQGDINLTSSAAPMLSVAGCGANGSTVGQGLILGTNPGIVGVNADGNFTKTGAAGGLGLSTPTQAFAAALALTTRYMYLFPGAGGGAGGNGFDSVFGNPTGGVGGSGGGALYIECAGAWNFTTTNGISVAGNQGGTGGVVAGRPIGAAGGGGGAGGSFAALVKSITANTGTIKVTGGKGGTGGNGGAAGGNGGDGSSGAGTGGQGGNSSASSGLDGGSGGGGGGSCYSTTNGSVGNNAVSNVAACGGGGGASGYNAGVQINDSFA